MEIGYWLWLNKRFIFVMCCVLGIPSIIYCYINRCEFQSITFSEDYVRFGYPLLVGLVGIGLGSCIYLKFYPKKATSLDEFLVLVIKILEDAGKGDDVEIIFPSFNPGVAWHVSSRWGYGRYRKFRKTLLSKLKEGVSVTFYIIETDFSKWDNISTDTADNHKTLEYFQDIDDALIRYLCANLTIPSTGADAKHRIMKQISKYFSESAKLLSELRGSTIQQGSHCNFNFLSTQYSDTRIVSVVSKNKIFMGSYFIDTPEKGSEFSCCGEIIDNKFSLHAIRSCKDALLKEYTNPITQ